jgi:hypothetical protein
MSQSYAVVFTRGTDDDIGKAIIVEISLASMVAPN